MEDALYLSLDPLTSFEGNGSCAWMKETFSLNVTKVGVISLLIIEVFIPIFKDDFHHKYTKVQLLDFTVKVKLTLNNIDHFFSGFIWCLDNRFLQYSE